MGRLDKLPPYLFSAIDAAKEKARAAGVSVVDLGVGDPDRPTPGALVEVMARAVADPAFHCYPAQRGDAGLKQAIALWLADRHGVQVDPVGGLDDALNQMAEAVGQGLLDVLGDVFEEGGLEEGAAR